MSFLLLIPTGSTLDRQECLSYSLIVLKCNLHERYHVRVVLLLAFEFYQIVVSAARSRGEFATHERPRVIDCALSRLLVQEHAGLSKQFIGLATKYAFLIEDFGEALRGNFRRESKIGRQPADVARRNLHAIVNRAAIRDAFVAVILQSFGSGSRL